jgi:hypothetical protein
MKFVEYLNIQSTAGGNWSPPLEESMLEGYSYDEARNLTALGWTT